MENPRNGTCPECRFRVVGEDPPPELNMDRTDLCRRFPLQVVRGKLFMGESHVTSCVFPECSPCGCGEFEPPEGRVCGTCGWWEYQISCDAEGWADCYIKPGEEKHSCNTCPAWRWNGGE